MYRSDYEVFTIFITQGELYNIPGALLFFKISILLPFSKLSIVLRNDFVHIHKLLPLNVFHRVVVVYYIEDRNDVQLIAMHRGNNHHRNTNKNNKDLVEINS